MIFYAAYVNYVRYATVEMTSEYTPVERVVCVQSSGDDVNSVQVGGSSKRGADCLDDECPPTTTLDARDIEAFNDPSGRPSNHLPTRHALFLVTLCSTRNIVMVALCNTTNHYIFAL